jgi:PPOX class probable F420-dependent enzyme
MELPPEARAFIERQRVARLATVGADGTPHLVPICFALAGEVLYSAIDDKPKRSARPQRVRDVAARPAVAVLFDHYDDDWSRLGWVQLRGQASLLEAGAEHEGGLAALRARYPGYRSLTAGRLVIRIEPLTARTWGALGALPSRRELASAALDAPAGDARGLNLVRQRARIAAAHVATEYRAGIASGRLARLHAGTAGAERVRVEPDDEAATPDEGGRMLRYALATLADGVYVAESTGPANIAATTFFEVAGGVVTRLFESERRALTAARHAAR